MPYIALGWRGEIPRTFEIPLRMRSEVYQSLYHLKTAPDGIDPEV